MPIGSLLPGPWASLQNVSQGLIVVAHLAPRGEAISVEGIAPYLYSSDEVPADEHEIAFYVLMCR